MTARTRLVRFFSGAIIALIAVLIAPTGAGALQSDDAIWKQFIDWLPKAPRVDGPPSMVFNTYRTLLIKNGASPEQADQQLDVIRRAHRERPDAWRIMFNNIYKSDKPEYATQPNALLVSTVEGRKPGRALDIGMGQGRNSVFLALKGWDVTGFDMSDEGISTARRNAERAGVKINAHLQNEDAFDYGTNQWDLIVFMYEPFPITSAAYVDRLQKSMKPGGIVVIEGFGEEETVKNRPTTAIDPDRLLAAFRDFRLLHYQDVVATPDWGGPKPRRVVRMIAERRP
jgi:2-polyprenyl-3-methyl-5-hydroxy-6-metoxy-1,4-benzoquinol methylase